MQFPPLAHWLTSCDSSLQQMIARPVASHHPSTLPLFSCDFVLTWRVISLNPPCPIPKSAEQYLQKANSGPLLEAIIPGGNFHVVKNLAAFFGFFCTPAVAVLLSQSESLESPGEAIVQESRSHAWNTGKLKLWHYRRQCISTQGFNRSSGPCHNSCDSH